jgi:transposase-like protein
VIKIQDLLDEQQCYEKVRALRWADGVSCPHCMASSEEIVKRGKSGKTEFCQRYHCKQCDKDFNDLTNTIFTSRHQPLKTWILCLYFMGLNLSNEQIAKELGLASSDVYDMTIELREGIEQRREPAQLSGEIECDEVYVVAGHKRSASSG